MIRRLRGTLLLAWTALGQATFPERSPAAIRRAQLRRLASMVRHAYATVPYYAETMRKLALDPDAIRTPDDLARLPILERVQIQRDPEYFRSRARPREAYVPYRSGGSSGAPCVVYHDPDALLENTAHGEREMAVLRRLVGRRRFQALSVGSRRGTEEDVRETVRRHAWIPRVLERERPVLSVGDPPEQVALVVDELRPDVVSSYGSYLERLAQAMEATPGGHRPRVLAYGGDGMSPAARARIVERMGLRVWSSYQAIESFKIAFECELGTALHVHVDLCPVRIVDGSGADVAPGVVGDVVVSNLVNRGTVLLNYRIGDVASLLPVPCPCGRALPLLSFPQGRVEEWLDIPGGRRVFTQQIRTIFTDETQVWQYQIVQEATDRLRVALVAAEDADRPAIVGRVVAGFARVVGSAVAVQVEFVDTVERTADGKLRVVLRRTS